MSFVSLAARALEANFRLWGRDAIYRPAPGSSVGVPCRIIVDRSSDAAEIGAANFVAKRARVEVRRLQVASPAKSGVFEAAAVVENAQTLVAGETFTIVAAPRCEDDDAAVWTCLCDPSGPL
ncbi:hypothetical protein A1351_15495 [Methylosinus sp. R-45379]|uniref:head-tail joining protein n=1 Tax=Methylosinus sp. R-45379 TaxID=980563 RepID=UPI0007C8A82C|nr:hypothetical protein [Methylosinus sp. R-45379]OAI25955.1 hypothetical protein A1351_15495 [Methylosinus sp. R-45379]